MTKKKEFEKIKSTAENNNKIFPQIKSLRCNLFFQIELSRPMHNTMLVQFMVMTSKKKIAFKLLSIRTVGYGKQKFVFI